jgi:hypothetical protein
MSLQLGKVALQFVGGLSTKADPKGIATTKLLNLENATFIRETSLAKRNGYHALGNQQIGTGAQLVNPSGLGARFDELVKFANGRGYSYVNDVDQWKDCGAVTSVSAQQQPIARTGTAQSKQDVAVAGGVMLVTWKDSRGGVWAAVLNSVTFAYIVKATQIDANGVSPRATVSGGNLLLIYATTTGQLKSCVVNPVLPNVITTPKTFVTNASTASILFDVVSTTTGAFFAGGPTSVALAVWAVDGGQGFQLGYVTPAGQLGTPATGTASPSTYVAQFATTNALAVAWDSVTGNVAVGQVDGQGRNLVVYVFSSTFANYINLFTFDGGTSLGVYKTTLAFATGTSQAVWWAVSQQDTTLHNDLEVISNGAWTSTTTTWLTGGSGTVANINATSIYGHTIVGQAFSTSTGQVYLPIAAPYAFFSYVAVVMLSSGAGPASPCAARLLPGSTVSTIDPQLFSSQALGADVFGLALLYRIQLASVANQYSEVGVMYSALDFGSDNNFQSAQLGRGLYLGGAMMMHYDGERWAEVGFHSAPDTTSGTFTMAQSTGGNLTLTLTYSYKFVYEEIDAQGELHRGAVSPAKNIVLTGSNNSVTITIPTCRLTSRLRARIGVYRAVGNATGDDATIEYFRVSGIDLTVTTGANCYVPNNTGAQSVTFTDNFSDAALQNLEPLYTNGGILSNDPPNFGGGVLAGGKNRLFWTDPVDPNLVRYSQGIADQTAVELAQPLAIRVDPYGGAIVGLCVLDDAIIVLKETAVHLFAGPGPDPDGGKTSTNAFTPSRLLTGDVGCKSPQSIAQTPIGVTFQSSKGIFLVGRDQSLQSIGDDVYAFNTQVISRATLLPDRHQIVFLVSTPGGFTLLYDYEHQQWSKYTNHVGYDATVVEGSYYYLRPDGRVFQETPGVYVDDNSHITMRIQTAWVKMDGTLQGWQRVIHLLALGTYHSDHQLAMRYQLDYQDAYSAPILASPTSVYMPSLYGVGAYGVGAYDGGVVANSVYQESFHINKRCQAISVEFSDVEAPTVFGAAFELSELMLTGGVIGTKFRVGAARQQ